MKGFWNTFKEEIITIPVLVVALLFFKKLLRFVFPESAQYDLPSEVETIVFSFIKLIFYSSLAWLALRIIFPAMYQHFKSTIYDLRLNKEDKDKNIVAIIFYALFLISLVLLSSCNSAYGSEISFRKNFAIHLDTQLYVREATGKNDGVEVEKYLKSVGLGKGYAWCAAYCSWNLSKFGIPNPNSAWSPHFAKPKDIIWSQAKVKSNKVIQQPQAGDCFTLWYPNLKRVGHVGFIVGEKGSYFITNEGNTNKAGSREGDGVYSKFRSKSKIYAVTNYITPYFKNKDEKATNISMHNYYAYRVQKHKIPEYGSLQNSQRLCVYRKDSKAQRYNYILERRHGKSGIPNKGHDYLQAKWQSIATYASKTGQYISRLCLRFYSYQTTALRTVYKRIFFKGQNRLLQAISERKEAIAISASICTNRIYHISFFDCSNSNTYNIKI